MPLPVLKSAFVAFWFLQIWFHLNLKLIKQAEKLKSREMKERWWRMMKDDEGWMKTDEGWWFQAVEGFCRRTDRQTDQQTFVNVKSLLRLKTLKTDWGHQLFLKTLETDWGHQLFLLTLHFMGSYFTCLSWGGGFPPHPPNPHNPQKF